jgi:hypothetical protein
MKQVRESLDEAIRKGVFPTRDLVYPFAELLICIGRSLTIINVIFLLCTVHSLLWSPTTLCCDISRILINIPRFKFFQEVTLYAGLFLKFQFCAGGREPLCSNARAHSYKEISLQRR